MNFLLKKSKEKIIFILGLIFSLLFSLSFWPKFSSLLINSDSYVYLLQVEFLRSHSSFSGQLGLAGDFLSPIFYRGGFSLFIYFLSYFFQINNFLSAQIIILTSHFLCILLVYLLISKLFRSVYAGLISSMLLTLSYSFTNWSTVVMPEIPTILLVIFSQITLLFSRKNKLLFSLSPIFLGLSVLFRGEMIMLLLPTIFILLYQKRILKEYLFYFATTLIIWFLYVLWLYQSSYSPNNWIEFQLLIFQQTINYHTYFIISLLFIFVGALLYLYRPYLIILLFLPLIIVLKKININFSDILPPLYSFLSHDWVIIIFGFFGLFLIVLKNRYLGGYFLFSLLILIPLYITRGEYRYYVHLIIFFLVPLGFLLKYLWFQAKSTIWKFSLIILSLLIVLGQYKLSQYQNFLPNISYEQSVADQTNQVIKLFNFNSSDIVICSVFSEAMYYTTNFSSMDCFSGLNDINRKNNVGKLVVVDEDISRHQPEFVSELTKLYPDQPIYSQWILQPYQEKNTTSIPRQQTRWYYIPPNTSI